MLDKLILYETNGSLWENKIISILSSIELYMLLTLQIIIL